MPIVTISVKQLNHFLTREFPMDVVIESLEQLGCDVEDTVEIALDRCPACDTLNDRPAHEDPANRCDFCGHESETGFDTFASDTGIRLDLLADRPDLFNVGGLARALKGYLGLEKGMPEFSCQAGDIEVRVDPSVLSVRPHIACAVSHIPPLDHTTLRELMKLQENLHWGIGRDRKLASIGIYNLDSLKPPILYKTMSPTDFEFHPLGMPDVAMNGATILDNHPKGTAYAHLLKPHDRYPLLIDDAGLALSMPPIINSEESKCRIGTSRLFIDVTGMNRQAVSDSLNNLVCAIRQMGGDIRTARINYPDARVETTPDLAPQSIHIGLEATRKWLGIPLEENELVSCVQKMRLDAIPQKDNDQIEIRYPAYRSDIRHEVDIFEDIVIGYGLHRVPQKLVPTMTVGLERPEEIRCTMAREVMTGLGFTEIMSLNLHSEENHFNRLRLDAGAPHVRVDNPKTLNQRVLRSHLMTGIMETLEKNRKKVVPQCIFEIGPVTTLNPETETGINEYRHLAFAIIGPDSGYAGGRAVLDSLLREMGLTGEYRPAEHPPFIDGRCAEVIGENGLWARLGEIHPEVLDNFNLSYPLTLGEVRLAQVF